MFSVFVPKPKVKRKNICWIQREFLEKKIRNFDEFLLSGAGQSCDVILP